MLQATLLIDATLPLKRVGGHRMCVVVSLFRVYCFHFHIFSITAVLYGLIMQTRTTA